MKYPPHLALITPLLVSTFWLPAACGQANAPADSEPGNGKTRHILFVGDSFTHGRYLPVRTFHNTPGTGGLGSTSPSPLVVDENFNTAVAARKEDTPGEYGPWGGIPGIFAELAHEAGLAYDVHIEAISATTLAKNYSVAKDVIAQPLWDDVVLQEASYEPIPSSLSQNPNSNPQRFCRAVRTIERGVHEVAPASDIYLYDTWAPADTAYLDSTENGSTFSRRKFLDALKDLTVAYHDAYASAAAEDAHIRDIAPVGDAWALAWLEGAANPDPYSSRDGASPDGTSLSFNYQPDSDPSTRDVPTDAGFHHPSRYGAYLSALVLFQTITHRDARSFGEGEKAAEQLGIAPREALAFQRVAWETVSLHNSHPLLNPHNPCTPTN